MTTTMDPMVDVPVRKSVSVKVSQAVAFRVFTEEIDTWWPRTHHIGKAPMKKQIIQGRVGGRCYTEQTDGTDCEWGTVLVWDPPRRFVFAWQIDAQWQFVPDVEKSSEVEVRFTRNPMAQRASLWNIVTLRATPPTPVPFARRSIRRADGAVCCSCLPSVPSTPIRRADRR